ncbi:hypothetical protein AQJ58_24800 [Streptomyces sp. DSM 15324]|nr:hypothetical protein AQJ58_24800 [Streptomyces sp. DSM 15324]
MLCCDRGLVVPTDVWGVLDGTQCPSWSFVPFARVGPLEFGMTHDQAQAAAAVPLMLCRSLTGFIHGRASAAP